MLEKQSKQTKNYTDKYIHTSHTAGLLFKILVLLKKKQKQEIQDSVVYLYASDTN